MGISRGALQSGSTSQGARGAHAVFLLIAHAFDQEPCVLRIGLILQAEAAHSDVAVQNAKLFIAALAVPHPLLHLNLKRIGKVILAPRLVLGMCERSDIITVYDNADSALWVKEAAGGRTPLRNPILTIVAA